MIKRFMDRHSYDLLISGSVLDAITTWIAVEALGGYELNPVMAVGFAMVGIIPMLALKVAVTAEGGRMLLSLMPRLVKVLAIGFWAVGFWNLAGIALVLFLS